MTEQEWLGCSDPTLMLDFLRSEASDRKLRLLAVACCHRIWSLLPVACQNFNDVLERYADGLVTTAEYQVALGLADAQALDADRDSPDTLTYATASVGVSNPPTVPSVSSCMDTAASAVACALAENAADSEYDTTHDAAWMQERYEQVRLVLDIFGNPFRSITLDPAVLAWNDAKVVRLAQAAYEERHLPEGTLDNSRLAVLADALEEAGWTSEEILGHLRGPGRHVRGCWPVDLCLGKS
jgi:hypothetical protein